MAKSSCVVCGEFILIGEICRDCEEKVLKEVRSKARILSTVTTVIFLLLVYKVWGLYAQGIMNMDTAAIRNYPLAFEISFEILRSPRFFPSIVVGLILIVFAFLYGLYYKKIFLDSSKII